jgi:hypothetical protein
MAKAADVVLGNLEPHHPGDGHRRVIGHGQVKFDSLGPEAWAARWRRERLVVVTLRRHLAAQLDHLVYLVTAFECVHRYEGTRGANTGNGYALQMDVPLNAPGRELRSHHGTARHGRRRSRWRSRSARTRRAASTRGRTPLDGAG